MPNPEIHHNNTINMETARPIDPSQYKDLSALDLIRLNIKTERSEDIDVNLLELEESIIDEAHRDDLLKSMEGDRHQVNPIVVRARLNEKGEIRYDIIDGFHRGSGLKLKSEMEHKQVMAKATVLYGCSDEELFDQRVLAVNSVKGVSFPRLIHWMQRSFEETVWYKKGLTLSQVLSLAERDSIVSRMLTTEETIAAKEWARKKASTWNKPLSSIAADTRAAENAAPDIVLLVRVGAGGSQLKKGILNPARFHALVEELPEDYELQRMMVEIITKHNLDQHQIRAVARELAKVRDNPESLELIRMDPLSMIGELTAENGEVDAYFDDNSSVQQEDGERNQGNHRKRKVQLSRQSATGYLINPDEISEKSSLEEALSQAHHALEERSVGGNAIWYETVPNLSSSERQISTLFFGKGFMVDEIADSLNVLPHKVFQALQSVTTKYQIERKKDDLLQIISSVNNDQTRNE